MNVVTNCLLKCKYLIIAIDTALWLLFTIFKWLLAIVITKNIKFAF